MHTNKTKENQKISQTEWCPIVLKGITQTNQQKQCINADCIKTCWYVKVKMDTKEAHTIQNSPVTKMVLERYCKIYIHSIRNTQKNAK